MSMKRSKQRNAGGRDKDTDSSFWQKASDPEKTWATDVDGKPDDAFTTYAMTERFAKGQLIVHPKFGKGIVVDVEPGRVEIAFQDGKKKLGHGQPQS